MSEAAECIYFEDWQDFKARFAESIPLRNQACSIGGSFLFRGQMDETWNLTSSFDRLVSHHSAVDRTELFRDLLKCFCDYASRWSEISYSSDDEKSIALAQHYGLPTRLLDWSASPYVAAFFAFVDVLENTNTSLSHVAVWALNAQAMRKYVSPNLVKVISISDWRNIRMRNQSGSFTLLLNDDISLDGYLERLGKPALSCLAKMLIPTECARTAVEDMLLMGISPTSIYGGYEGMAQHAKLEMMLKGRLPISSST